MKSLARLAVVGLSCLLGLVMLFDLPAALAQDGFGQITAEKIARQFLKPLGNQDKQSDDK